MLGCYDFCGHYEWTFEWLRQQGGEPLVHQYWEDCIYRVSQTHATELIHTLGFEGMARYWDHTLVEEGAGFVVTRGAHGDDFFRVDMTDCPSKGFLIQNSLEQYHDYCDHCMGWINPLMEEGGFAIDHEHNHMGQCWWEIRKTDNPAPFPEAGTATEHDVRLQPNWTAGPVQRFARNAEPTGEAE